VRNLPGGQAKASESATEKRMARKSLEGLMNEVKPILDLFRPAGHFFEQGQESAPHDHNQAGSGNETSQHSPNRHHGPDYAEKQQSQA
jgi:hypothetical protein